MFGKLKYKSGLKALESLQKKNPRKKFIYNLTTARKVGIVFEGSITGIPEEIKAFMQYLKSLSLDVYAIGFVDIKELTVGLEQNPSINFFSRKELKWNGVPSCQHVAEFANLRLDILIDFSRRDHMAMRSVTALSQASFKVGFISYDQSPFDFTLAVKEGESISYIIEQAKHYLMAINNRHYHKAGEK